MSVIKIYTKRICSAAFIIILLVQSCLAVDPRNVLASVIYQLQTGTLMQNWYGPNQWQAMYQQTNGSGIYPQLRMLGPVQQVTLLESQGFPQGNVFKLRANHQAGTSDWVLGIGNFSNQIDYAFFNIGNTGNPLPPLPNPTPTPTDKPPTPSTPDADSCQLYPDLC